MQKKDIISVRLTESELDYLNELVEQGYNRCAVIRKGLNLFRRVNEKPQERQTRELNDK